jgi:hypothetical protein
VPFDGTTYFEIFDQHLESAPARLDVLRADCPGEFADLVDWMLAKDPYERPENGHMVAEACEQLLASRAISGTRKSNNSTPVKQLSSDELNLTQRLQRGTHADRSTPNWKLLGIVAAVLVAVVIGVVMMNR